MLSFVGVFFPAPAPCSVPAAIAASVRAWSQARRLAAYFPANAACGVAVARTRRLLAATAPDAIAPGTEQVASAEQQLTPGLGSMAGAVHRLGALWRIFYANAACGVAVARTRLLLAATAPGAIAPGTEQVASAAP